MWWSVSQKLLLLGSNRADRSILVSAWGAVLPTWTCMFRYEYVCGVWYLWTTCNITIVCTTVSIKAGAVEGAIAQILLQQFGGLLDVWPCALHFDGTASCGCQTLLQGHCQLPHPLVVGLLSHQLVQRWQWWKLNRRYVSIYVRMYELKYTFKTSNEY